MSRYFIWILLVTLLVGCGEDGAGSEVDVGPDVAAEADPTVDLDDEVIEHPPGHIPVPATEQRAGDPEAGYEFLIYGNYVGCGAPRIVWDTMNDIGGAPAAPPAPGREDTRLPYYVTEFSTPTGVEVVSPNCLICHAQEINGELVIGVGGLTFDFGGFAAQMTSFDESFLDMAEEMLGLSEDQSFELRKFYDRLQVVAPYVQAQTVGVSAADNLAAILFAHRDPETLEWFDEPLMEPPPQIVVPLSVPPWWNMRYKNSMLYIGAGRGDLSRIMMAASVLCVDDVELAREIDTHMPDVYAYLRSLEPPEYPWEIDADAAERGRVVYDRGCGSCHGTYTDAGLDYPNYIIDQSLVGTDPALSLGGSQFADRFIEWFNDSSFFGEMSSLEATAGYVAPPLDGLWATAPYLHNGSIPTIEALLDSSARPRYWTWSYDTNHDFDPESLGWIFTELDYGQDDEGNPDSRRLIYDTTLLGYSNSGHTFGDVLSADDRMDLIEYLKTL
jgi:cytochrome c5